MSTSLFMCIYKIRRCLSYLIWSICFISNCSGNKFIHVNLYNKEIFMVFNLELMFYFYFEKVKTHNVSICITNVIEHQKVIVVMIFNTAAIILSSCYIFIPVLLRKVGFIGIIRNVNVMKTSTQMH